MATNGKQFIVLAFGERGVTYGVSEKGEGSTIPWPLVELISLSKADSWDLRQGGCIAYFLGSRRTLRILEDFVSRTETLRDAQFPTLGIGLAHGYLFGQCDWLGRLKRDFIADAATVNQALAGVQGAQTYREVLKELQGSVVRTPS
jgi:hypothetical protein